jgi:hypothetical protein
MWKRWRWWCGRATPMNKPARIRKAGTRPEQAGSLDASRPRTAQFAEQAGSLDASRPRTAQFAEQAGSLDASRPRTAQFADTAKEIDSSCRPELAELMAQLQLTMLAAGEPSFRQVAARMGHRLSHSTISRLLRSATPPKWENLELLLVTLGVTKEEVRRTWHPRWVRAKKEANPEANPNAGAEDAEIELLAGTGVELASLTACRTCGAGVLDRALHDRWHQRMARPETFESRERGPYRRTPIQRPRAAANSRS